MHRSQSESRIDARFSQLKQEQRGGLITFLTAGDPTSELSFDILCGLPQAGADIVELGMPFSDPMADGPAIQAASLRALRAGMTLAGTLDMVRRFRRHEQDTPVVLMGYYNPIYRYGASRFLADAADAGVDGLIIVDLPAEEDDELCQPAVAAGMHWIRLLTPTTTDQRLQRLLVDASGFLYYVSIAGVTGTRSATQEQIDQALKRIRRQSDLPVAVGFGIKTPTDGARVATSADAAVVGSALVQYLADRLDGQCRPQPGLVDELLGQVTSMARVLRTNGGSG